MRHTREEVIEREKREFEDLDRLVANLSDEKWNIPVPRPETKDQWTVKDALAHITHWKADAARKVRKEPVPPEERGLNINDGNHLIYERWREKSPQVVLAWHRQVHADLLAVLRATPDDWFSGKDRAPEWPNDLDSHITYHRIKDIEQALAEKK